MHADGANATVAGDVGWWNATSFDGGGGGLEASATQGEAGERWWPLFLGSFVICTLFGNALVVASVVKFKYLRSVTNYFIVSLAVADIAVGALVMPLAVYVEVMDGRFMLPDELCDGWIAFDVMASTASILNMVAISIDRFMAITHPLKYQHSIKNSVVYTATTIAVGWLVSIGIALPVALGANYTPYRVVGECAFANPLFIIFSSMGSFFIPSVVMILLYWKIFKVIRERAAAAKEKSRDRKRALSRALSASDGSTAAAAGSGDDGVGGGGGSGYAEMAATAASNGGCDGPHSAYAEGEQTSGIATAHTTVASATAAAENGADESAASEDVWIRQTSTKSSNRVLPDDIKTSQAQALLLLPPAANGTSNGAHHTAKTKTTTVATTKTAAAVVGGKKAAGDSRRKDKKERKATITLVVVLGAFLFCWIPFFILNNVTAVCLQLYGDARVCSIPPWLYGCFVWLGYCNSTVNPLIYAVLNNDFRRAFLKLLHLGGAKGKGAHGRVKK